jgi:hypothetical protein
MNLLLLAAGYPPAVIHSTERQRYYDALKTNENALAQIVKEALTASIESSIRFLEARLPPPAPKPVRASVTSEPAPKKTEEAAEVRGTKAERAKTERPKKTEHAPPPAKRKAATKPSKSDKPKAKAAKTAKLAGPPKARKTASLPKARKPPVTARAAKSKAKVLKTAKPKARRAA